MTKEYLPKFRSDAFYCPRCKVLVPQRWYKVFRGQPREPEVVHMQEVDLNIIKSHFPPYGLKQEKYHNEWDLEISVCTRCKKYTVWENENVIYPHETGLPDPHEDMPKDVQGIYREAMGVYMHSPRASAALLRLVIETMIPQLEEYQIKKAKINTMIGELVKKDIPDHIQQGLDAIRIYGNEGIHPGEIALNDDQETVMFLFELINIMVEELITRKKKIRSFYGRLPTDKIKGVINRDKVKVKVKENRE